MGIDYDAAQRLFVKHKRVLAAAKKRGPDAVLEAVDAFYADFRNADLPLPDDWAAWERAREDARWTILRTQETWR